MSTKPKILAKSKRIINLEKRKTPLTPDEYRELFEFRAARLKRDNERNAWEDEQRLNLLAKRREKELEREKKFQDRCECVYQAIQGMMQSNTPKPILGRMIGVLIRELRPYVYTGWQSAAYLNAVEKTKLVSQSTLNATKDHIYPTQFNGEFIATHTSVMNGLSKEYYDGYIEVMCQVADVLPQENRRLGTGPNAPQKADRFLTPEHAYKKANIEVNFTPIRRLEDVAPIQVLRAHFGDRLEEMYKYNC